jgi:hypothetical protein
MINRGRPRIAALPFGPAILACVLMLGGTGCFGMSSPKKPRAIESAAGIDPSITPFKLEVVEELYDGADIVIKGRITPKDEWDPKEVVVRLAALDDRGQQRLSFHRVSDLAPQSAVLAAGVATPFSLTLPSEGLTNYQVEVLWGQEAQPFGQPSPESSPAAKEGAKPFLALRNLEVHRVPGESCANPNECELKFTITGEFFNSGGATVRNVVILAGFTTPDKLDLQDQILENERRIEVRNMGLKPGASKPFRLALEKHVTALDQAAPQPAVRIVSVESDM